MARQEILSLSVAARLLDEPKHRLIYLCEKGAVIPDFGQARGRGSSRGFSTRNILEFAVALKLRELMLPVAVVGAITYVIREFEKRVGREIKGFSLPGSLRETDSPELRIIITDGPLLYFALGRTRGPAKVYGGIDLRGLISRKKRPSHFGKDEWRRSDLPVSPGDGVSASAGRGGVEKAWLEVNVTRIARDLRLDG